MNYVSGGGAANLPVRVSALVRGKYLSFADYADYSFSAPRGAATDSGNGEETQEAGADARVIADKLPLTLDKNGAGKLKLEQVPKASQPQDLVLEATYADPNGEVQTLRSTHTLWPAAVVAGIKTEGWVSSRQKMRFTALALDLAGKPQEGVPLEVRAVARIVTTTRKRMVGGFYTYDNQTSTKDLGEVCSGKSDARGLLLCDTSVNEAGEVELVVSAKDSAGNKAQAASSVYVTKQGELWFGGENHDRIDLLPEKKSYNPGETARFQVRMPFRFATALVAVEREGILETEVVQLNGQDPTVQVKVKGRLGPQRVCERAGPARAAARSAVVQLLHLGLQGPARVVAELLVRRARVRGPHRAGGPEQAGLPPRCGRNPCGHPGPPAGREREGRQGQLRRAQPRQGDGAGEAAQRRPGRPCRGGPCRCGPGPAGADAQCQLEPARRHAAAAQLGGGNVHRADGDHRPAPLRAQGRARRWRRWQERRA